MYPGRRPLSAEVAALGAGKLQHFTISMDNIATEAEPALKGVDTVFWVLGTTRKDAGSAAQFIKVELDWLTDAAKLAKQNGCKHFSLLTAQGANAGFWSCGLLYPKTKGLAEEAVKAQLFLRTSIFRPGLLDRGDKARAVEAALLNIVPTIKASEVAKVMVWDAEAWDEQERSTSVAIFSMGSMQKAAKLGCAPVP
jgi:oxidoreductase